MAGFRSISPVAKRSAESRLTEPKAGARSRRRGLLFMPRSRYSRPRCEPGQMDGERNLCLFAAAGPILGHSGRWENIVVHVEEVLRIVFRLELSESLIIRAVGGRDRIAGFVVSK